MNFSKLTKEKKKHLAGVIAGTLVILAVMVNFLIQGGYQKVGALNQKKQVARGKLEQMQAAVKKSKEVQASCEEMRLALDEREQGMATGDLYSWMHSTLRKFQREYKVEIPQISPVSAPTDVNLIPKFPYKQAALAIAGSAYYHDLGRFISDFENAYPLMRIVNLNLELNPAALADERDKLAFKMEIVTLVKP